MLVITPKQLQVFEQAAVQRFEDDMLAHLADFSAPLYQSLGEQQMRVAIQFGIAQAQQYGFSLQGPVRTYLELMLLFGSHFDSDPQYPWATKILNDRNSGSEMQRAELLYQQILDYQDKVAGPNEAYTLAAFKNLAMFAQQPLTIAPDNFVVGMMRELQRIYPQKAAYMGNAALEFLVRKGLAGAQRQRFSTMRGAVLVIVLMMAFGHGCGADPLYPWISKTLNDDSQVSPEAKAERLEKHALTWLTHVIKYFESEVSV